MGAWDGVGFAGSVAEHRRFAIKVAKSNIPSQVVLRMGARRV